MVSEFKARRKRVLTDPLRYDTVEDVNQRLVGGYLKYRGQAILAEVALPDLKIAVRDCINGEIKEIHSSDVELDIISPELGYVNNDTHTFFIERIPYRQYKQAVYFRNCVGYCEEGYVSAGYDGAFKALKPLEIGLMLMNIYPSWQDVHTLVVVEGVSISHAFHKHLCLSFDTRHKIYYIKFDMEVIGIYDVKKEKVLLFPQFNHSYYTGLLHKCGLTLGEQDYEDE